MGRADDSQLVTRAAGGDAEAFTEIVRRHRDTVYGYCYHRTGSFEDARDLTQETFVRAYTRLSQLRDATKLGAWLRRIAANLCTRWAESRKETPLEEIEEPAAHPESPRAELVREALSGLPENERLAVVLHYVDGLSYSDIARFLETTSGAVRGRLARGRERLRTEVLRMTREAFDENRLDEKFVIDAVNRAIRDAMDAYNLRMDRELSRKKTDEALALIEQVPADGISDPIAMADALVGLASRETILKEPDRAREHRERARALYEQAGHTDGIEKLRAELAYERLTAGDFRAAHKLYSEAAEYWLRCRAEGVECNDYEFLATARALESLGLASERSLVVHFLAGVGHLTREDTQAISLEGVALGFCDEGYPARVRNLPGPPPNPTPFPLVLIRNKPTAGDTLRFVNADGRAEETVFESLSETATTPAGTFRHCALSVSQIFAAKEWEGEPVARRRLWIAPGVGVVRISYEDIGAPADTSELVACHVAPSDDYIPLAVGNWWKWRWIEGEGEFGFRTEICKEIVEADGGKFIAMQYSYAVRVDREAG